MGYRIEKVKTDEKSLNAIKKILLSSFPKATNKFTLDFLRWQYRDNPAGEIVGFNALWGDQVAAHYVAMPYYMMISGRKALGLLSLNTATHPAHRGKQLFTKLAEKTYEYAADNGYEFVIGVANQNSTHGFLKHLHFKLVSPLVFKVGLGSVKYDEVEKYEYSGCWDKKMLEWRTRCPSYNYYKNGKYIVSPMTVGFKKLIYNDNANEAPTYLQSLKLNPFNLYIGLGGTPMGIFINMPKFIPHSPFNLIFRDLTGNLPEIKKENVLFQLIDFDVA